MSRRMGPLRRWSRRKATARSKAAGAVPGPPAEEAEPPSSGLTPTGAAGSRVPPTDASEPDPADYGLPPIESLGKDSDFSAFLAVGVPEVLRRAALRKLWLSDPVLANLDGLNDYDEDFNAARKLLSAIDGRYRVGRGMVNDGEQGAEATEPVRFVGEAETTADGAAPESVDAETPERAEGGRKSDAAT